QTERVARCQPLRFDRRLSRRRRHRGGGGSGECEAREVATVQHQAMLSAASRAEGTESARPTASVVMLPITAYHGQAIGVHNQTEVMTAMPVSIPVNAATVPSRFIADSRKTPRIGPLMREATPRAVF